MPLRDIQHVIAIVEAKTFPLAALRACITLPALSRSLQGLEASLHARMIARGLRHGIPTAAGSGPFGIPEGASPKARAPAQPWKASTTA
jgi:DNA-binding transcriptional LysR family regulator